MFDRFIPAAITSTSTIQTGARCSITRPSRSWARIIDFYEERGIPYFLFGPQLTLFSGNRPCNYICCGAVIEYENGAKVNTGFVTSYGEWKIDTAPELWEEIDKAQREAKNENKNDR